MVFISAADTLTDMSRVNNIISVIVNIDLFLFSISFPFLVILIFYGIDYCFVFGAAFS